MIQELSIVGIDLAKSVFHLVGIPTVSPVKSSPLNLSHFVEDQNDPSTSQILPSWPYVQWWGRAPLVRSTPPVQRRSADESCAETERTRRILVG